MVIINVQQINGQNDDVKYSIKEIETLVEKLSWESVRFKGCFTGLEIEPTGYAARLVEIGKPASSKLLEVFVDEKKCVAAHIVLTKIYRISYSLSSTSIIEKANSTPIVQKNDHKKKVGLAGILGIESIGTIGTIYRFNELEWTIFDSGVQIVNKNDLSKNYEKWKQIIFNQQNLSELQQEF